MPPWPRRARDCRCAPTPSRAALQRRDSRAPPRRPRRPSRTPTRGRTSAASYDDLTRSPRTLRPLCLLHTIASLMDKTGIHPGGEHAHVSAPGHEEHHEELGFWRKYVFSLDHKVIGIQYAITGLFFLMFGFMLMMLMRYQLAYPGSPL